MDFEGLLGGGGRDVVGQFNGGTISSDGGVLLLAQVEEATGILAGFAACFEDQRDPDLIEHTVTDLIKQRVFGLCLGYEDLIDHDQLRHDPLFAVAVGKSDPTGAERLRRSDCGKPLAGKSTLNRLELSPISADKESRYKKIPLRHSRVDRFFVETFLDAHVVPPESIILDVDATDDPVHGEQLGRFFHGYYGEYCFLPLYIFCGEHLLCSRLRPADIDASAGTVKELARIVQQIRERWPEVQITLRGDSGFCRESIMSWCEANRVEYLLGLARNPRLEKAIQAEQAEAVAEHARTKLPARVFKDFSYRTVDSWSRERRVVGKAEQLDKGANPRFVVTSLSAEAHPAQELYENVYCARGEAENRIKEQQLYLFADRTSAATLRANQLRLWFSSVAYTLLVALRRLGLAETPLADAQCQTIRLRLFKVGALVRITVRKVWVAFSQSWPFRELFQKVYANLQGAIARRVSSVSVVPTLAPAPD
jgi:hypothetical protein